MAESEEGGPSGGWQLSEPDELVDFDWNDSKHMTFLNKWRRQYLFRTTNQISKPKAVPFSDTEDEWLWHRQAKLMVEKWDELLGRTSHKEDADDAERGLAGARKKDAHKFKADGSNFPLVAKASIWRRRRDEFNAKFAGKTMVSDGDQAEAPRPVRLAGSLNVHSHRIGAIIKDFHLNSNKAHRKRNRIKTNDMGGHLPELCGRNGRDQY